MILAIDAKLQSSRWLIWKWRKRLGDAVTEVWIHLLSNHAILYLVGGY